MTKSHSVITWPLTTLDSTCVTHWDQTGPTPNCNNPQSQHHVFLDLGAEGLSSTSIPLVILCGGGGIKDQIHDPDQVTNWQNIVL